MSDRVSDAGATVADALRRLTPLFTADVNLTFIMTHPKDPGCYMVISNEASEVLIAAINASRKPARTEEGL
jgi:hypothetical protein